MKKGFLVLLQVVVIIIFMSINIYATEPIHKETKSVKYSSGTKTVHVIYADLNNKNIKIYSALANNQIRTATNLSEIIESKRNKDTKIIAGMNGNYFDAYTKTKQAYGIVIDNEEILHVDYNLSICIGFDSDNKFYLGNIYVNNDVTIEKSDGTKLYDGSYSVNSYDYKGIYTPLYGDKTPEDVGDVVVVKNDQVAQIAKGQVNIPVDGYVICTNNVEKYEIGDIIIYSYKTSTDTKLNTIVAGGPVLVEDGMICESFEQPGSSESFINGKAMRNFIGVTKDNQLIMANVSGVSLKELAEIAFNMGAVDAFNMDGGASAGLYYNDKYFVRPGREVAVGLIVAVEENVESIDKNLSEFKDIKETDWFVNELISLAEKNIITGYDDGTFRPSTNVRADAFIKMVICALGYDELEKNSEYWAQEYIDKAIELNLIKNNEIVYDEYINREQIAVIISRAFDVNTEYKSQNNITDWQEIKYKDEVLKVYELGIINGYKDGSFAPKNKVTRAETVVIISRFLQQIK